MSQTPEKFYALRHLRETLGDGWPSPAQAYVLATKGRLHITKMAGKSGITESEAARFQRAELKPADIGAGK